MNDMNIEKLDAKRQSIFLMITLFWSIWFGVFILKELIHKNSIVFDLTLALLAAGSFVFLLIYFLKYIRLSSTIKNSRYNEALNNELYRFYKSRSLNIGFLAIMITSIGLLILDYFIDLTAILVCEINIYIGVLTIMISELVLNKQSDDN